MIPATITPTLADHAPSRRLIAKASAINLVARLAGGAAGLALAILTTHVLDVHGRGTYAILTTLATISVTVLTGCSPVMVADFVHGRRDTAHLRGALAALSVATAAVLVVGVIIVAAAGLRIPGAVGLAIMTSLAVAVLIYAGCEISLAQGRGDIASVSIGEFGLAVLPLIFSAVVASAGHADVDSLILAWLIGVSFVAAAQITLALQRREFTLERAFGTAWDLARRSRSIAFSNGVLQLCSRVDVLIVSIVLSVSAAGIYSIPVALAANLMLFSRALMTATYRSLMTAPLPELRERVARTVRYGACAVLAAGAIGVPIVAFAAGPVFGEPYANVWRPLAILVPGIAAWSTVEVVRHALLTRLERHREVLIIAIAIAAVNAILAVAGSAWFGLDGAAASTTITYIGAALAMLFVLSSVLRSSASNAVGLATLASHQMGERTHLDSPRQASRMRTLLRVGPTMSSVQPPRQPFRLRTLLRLLPIPLLLGGLGAVAGLLYSRSQPVLYESRSQVVVSPATKFLDPEAGSAFPIITTTVQELALTQIVTVDAARRVRMQGFPAPSGEWVRQRLRLSVSGDTPVLAISGVAGRKALARAISVNETDALIHAIQVASSPGASPAVLTQAGGPIEPAAVKKSTPQAQIGVTLTIFARGEDLGQIQPLPSRNVLLGGLAGLMLGAFFAALIVSRTLTAQAP